MASMVRGVKEHEGDFPPFSITFIVGSSSMRPNSGCLYPSFQQAQGRFSPKFLTEVLESLSKDT